MHAARRAMATLPWGATRYCVICRSRVRGFLPYRGGWARQPALMQTLQLVGSDLDNFACPVCGAHDRERHLLLYIKALGLPDRFRSARILHFAPEKHLSEILRSFDPREYVRADLMPASPDIQRVDITAMPYETGRFDIVIANHVLEHVNDVGRALAEIRRVLNVDGLAILQTPFSKSLHTTWQDDGIDDEGSRLQAYGQEDHVRLFGRDIVDRIVAAGFISRVTTHAAVLADKNAHRYGVNADEPLFLFERKSD